LNAEKCGLLLKDMEVLNKGKRNDDDDQYVHEFFKTSPSTDEVLPDSVLVTNCRAAGTTVVADDDDLDSSDMSDDKT
jgi:hypothetical protein